MIPLLLKKLRIERIGIRVISIFIDIQLSPGQQQQKHSRKQLKQVPSLVNAKIEITVKKYFESSPGELY
jgi:hypothetical protein